jgi:hypothetical protein
MLTSAYDQRQSHHRKEMSQQERFNEIADGELRMVLDGLFRTYSKRGILHLLYPNLQVMLGDDLGAILPDETGLLTDDAMKVREIMILTEAYHDQHYRKGEAA